MTKYKQNFEKCVSKIQKTQDAYKFRRKLPKWRIWKITEKKDLETFRGLSTDAKLILVFLTHKLAFQILPCIYSCCCRVAENVSVKNTHKNVWAFNWCRVWITRRIISNKKWANARLVLRYIYRSWMVYHHGYILEKHVAYFKSSRQRHLNI